MLRRRRLTACAITPLLGLVILLPTASGPAQAAGAKAATVKAAAAPPVVIGVDNLPPGGKSWTYTHYFPESNVNVPAGGLVLFQWSDNQSSGFHSVTFVPAGSSVAAERAARPTITNDTDNGESDVILPAISNNPTSSTCSTGPAAPPCVFDGTAAINSGIIPTGSGAAFAVQIAPSVAPGQYSYFCIIHPGMQGSSNVVAAGQPATDPATVAAQAGAEYNQLTAGALAAEAAASVPSSTANPDGSRTWTVHVGLTVDDVDLLEFLPIDLPIRKGDSVKFDGSGTTQEPHTVTSPGGAAQGMFFFGQNQCEVASGPDTPAAQVNGPPQLGCADPNAIEQPVNPHTQGVARVITSGDTTPVGAVVTGRADALAVGAEPSHTYTFANNGSYLFFCTIHANMFGIVTTPGYRVGAANGGVYTFGAADFFGSKGGSPPASPVVALPGTPDNQGYWLVTADGHTYNYGDAANVGNVPVHPASPIVGATSTGDGGGLWLVAKDGGVFALGDATYMGGMGGKHLNAPVVGIDSGFGGGGYDLVAADGGVFTFGVNGNTGGPRYFGSMGGQHLNAPIVAIADTASGNGYYLAAADGGVFTFGDAHFGGSLGAIKLAAPITSFAITFKGYRMAAADGGVFTFGTAPFFGSAVANRPGQVVGINGTA